MTKFLLGFLVSTMLFFGGLLYFEHQRQNDRDKLTDQLAAFATDQQTKQKPALDQRLQDLEQKVIDARREIAEAKAGK